MNILILDENPFDLKTFEKVFKGWGTIMKTKEPEEAMALVKKGYVTKDPFELIFLSTTLPREKGLSVLQKIRAMEDERRILKHRKSRIVMLAEVIDLSKVAKSFAYFCDAYLFHPIDSEKLKKKLNFLYSEHVAGLI